VRLAASTMSCLAALEQSVRRTTLDPRVIKGFQNFGCDFSSCSLFDPSSVLTSDQHDVASVIFL
jgi:hypothetical protein